VNRLFGLIIIGDEILLGGREDSHLASIRKLLHQRGHGLRRYWLLPDEKANLINHFAFSMAQNDPVFVCGGIGATPDDLTRACAAEAAGVPLEYHPEAVALIEKRYGDEAHPTRIRMAHLPRGAELIPNPYNQIPGFSINHHHFLPGFPEMAWPMAEWILEAFYPPSSLRLSECSVEVMHTPESLLVAIMENLNERFPDIKTFSLPRLGTDSYIELGLRGSGDISQAFIELKQALREQQIPFR
jgi:molybdopterin-biosynthesis enzyme MoeA-like protein